MAHLEQSGDGAGDDHVVPTIVSVLTVNILDAPSQMIGNTPSEKRRFRTSCKTRAMTETPTQKLASIIPGQDVREWITQVGAVTA